MNCPFCRGRGYTEQPSTEEEPLRIYCDSCSSTGDYETMRLVRACRLGEAKGYADAVARMAGREPLPSLNFKTIVSAVVDDVRRQRHEEMLAPDSPERVRLEAQVGQLVREREPMLATLGAWAAEVRGELERLA